MGANRAILLTPPGAAAIAVVRLVGVGTADFLVRHFSRLVPEGRAVHGNLIDGDRVIDDPVVVLVPGGCDLSIHGGPWVVRSVLELAARNGFSLIEPGDGNWPVESFDGEDEFELKIAAQIPLARTELALRWILAQTQTRRRRMLRQSLTSDSFNDDLLRWFLNPPKVAIIGPPNAGKSTIANCLFAQERSITADVPGTTRDWVGELADVDGLAIFLMDTPGLRSTNDSIEQTAIEQSQGEIAQADLRVLILDGSESLESQREWAAQYPGALVVRNKCDKASSIQPLNDFLPHLYTTATTGDGIDDLRQAICRVFLRTWRQPGPIRSN